MPDTPKRGPTARQILKLLDARVAKAEREVVDAAKDWAMAPPVPDAPVRLDALRRALDALRDAEALRDQARGAT